HHVSAHETGVSRMTTPAFAVQHNGGTVTAPAARTIPFGKPILGEEERQAVLSVLDSGILVHGPKIKEFEAAFARFAGAPHAVGVASCTAGLHLAYFHLGIGPGDE